MSTTMTAQPLSVHDLSVRFNLPVGKILRRLKCDAELRAMFHRVGHAWVTTTANLGAVAERLTDRATEAATTQG